MTESKGATRKFFETVVKEGIWLMNPNLEEMECTARARVVVKSLIGEDFDEAECEQYIIHLEEHLETLRQRRMTNYFKKD